MKKLIKRKQDDVFRQLEEDLEWLELGSIPENVYNPLLDLKIGYREENPVEEIVKFFISKEYLHFAAKSILNIELVPYQLVIMDTLWNKRLPMLVASRGGAKSFTLAVYCLLRMIFHPGCKIVIVGAGLRQAKNVFDYMADIWSKAPVLQDIAGKFKGVGPRREVDRFQFEIGDSVCIAIPLGIDGSKIRGLRANYIIADEFASINPDVFNLVIQGFAVVSSDFINKIKESATIKKLKALGSWTPEMESLYRQRIGGNQIIYSGTAFFAFNHFYKYYKIWHDVITSKGEVIKDLYGETEGATKGFNWQDYAILRIPYNYLPEGALDEGILAQARATLTHSQWLMEYCAIFPIDSDGFYRRSMIENATTNKPIKTASGNQIQFSAMRTGQKDRVYVMGIDPAADMDNASIIILEVHNDHRRIVYCWSTNKKRYTKLREKIEKSGGTIADDYYGYIVSKVRSLMSHFNTERIVMDKYGGGTAIAEALGSKRHLEEGDLPIYEVIDPEELKATDGYEGLHILELIAPSQEFNIEANHGMKKDVESKVLLFPMFDVVELAKAIEIDALNNIDIDTYEDVVQDIEELKNELTSIVVTPSPILGKETFDTPKIKTGASSNTRSRKDRFSALLYANFYCRNRGKEDSFRIQYKPVGATRETYKTSKKVNKNAPMYTGPGLMKFNGDAAAYGWISGKTAKRI
jgi:hypothetical protein